jgi:hypothetical protein
VDISDRLSEIACQIEAKRLAAQGDTTDESLADTGSARGGLLAAVALVGAGLLLLPRVRRRRR